MLTGSDISVMVGCLVLKYVQLGTQGHDLFGLFALSPCDECVLHGQNVFLGPTIPLPRLECCVESHHLHLIHLVRFFSRCVFKKGFYTYVLSLQTH